MAENWSSVINILLYVRVYETEKLKKQKTNEYKGLDLMGFLFHVFDHRRITHIFRAGLHQISRLDCFSELTKVHYKLLVFWDGQLA